MSYSEFSVGDVKTQFQLSFREERDLFASIAAAPVSSLLRDILSENVPLGLAISTEKARSELIVIPVLVEVRRLTGRKISLFSGIEFNVDAAQGLNGVCDFLLSLSPEQLTLEAPIVSIVEAKNDDLKAGLGQCIAEMVAARLFNQRNGRDIAKVFGVVTTGSLWKFMALEGEVVSFDLSEYHISEVERIIGVLLHMVRDGRGARAV